MRKSRFFINVFVPFVLLFTAEMTHATVVLSNSGATGSLACGPGTSTMAHSFTTGSEGPYTFRSVTYTLQDAGGTLTVGLHANNAGEPGAQLQALGVRSIGSGGGTNDYTFTGTQSLASNTMYWIWADSTVCSKLVAGSGDEPSGIFTYGSSLAAIGYDIASGTTIWGPAQSMILEIAVEGGTFDINTSSASAEQTRDFTYSFCYDNPSTTSANVQIDANIPTGSTFVSATGSYSAVPPNIMWMIAGVPAGSAQACVDMVVNVTANIGDTLTVNATLTSDQTILPGARTDVTSVVAPTPTGGGGGGGSVLLLELLVGLTILTFRSTRNKSN